MMRRALWRAKERAHPIIRHLKPQGPADLLAHWRNHRTSLCSGRFIGWANEFAVAHDLRIDFAKCRPYEDADDSDVASDQAVVPGHYIFDKGCLQLDALPEPFTYELPQHLAHWVGSLTERDGAAASVEQPEPAVFLAVARYEYANICHVLTDLYNAFLVLRLLDLDPKSVTVVLMDSHPETAFDELYRLMFADVRRPGDFTGVHSFKTFIFNLPGYRSPWTAKFQKRRYSIEAFRSFILACFDIEDRKIGRIRRITFVRRQDYEARKALPMQRLIANEDPLIEAIRNAFPDIEVKDVLLEHLGLRDQIQCAADTDVLVGMHGAGLVHALFLPHNAGLLELFPMYYSVINDRFYNVAYWRRLAYVRWKNWNPRLEFGGVATYVPPSVVIKRLKTVISAIEAG